METANGVIRILQNNESYSIYKKGIWLYIILLIFEGALRKWILPSLATPLLLVRDPIVIWLVIEGWKKGWINVFYAKAMMAVATLSFIITLLFGHQNILVALYGWRIYFFHFPMIFIIGKILTRDDILRICRFFLYISIPMTVLVVIQFYSPPTAWVNIGVGGEGTAGFGAVGNFMRPPGVFSFTAASRSILIHCRIRCFSGNCRLYPAILSDNEQFIVSKVSDTALADSYCINLLSGGSAYFHIADKLFPDPGLLSLYRFSGNIHEALAAKGYHASIYRGRYHDSAHCFRTDSYKHRNIYGPLRRRK